MRKKSLLLVIMLIGALLFAGCGGTGKTSSQSSDPRKAYEGTTLKVLLKTGYETEAIKQFVGDFEKATGIKVEYEIYDEPTVRNKLILDATSRTGAYDVVATQFWYMPEYLRAQALEPLDDYIKNKADKEWNSLDYIPKGLLNTYRGSDNKLYAVPVSASGGVLIYRTDLFKKYGLQVPKTTKDVLEAAKALAGKEKDVYPFIGRGESSLASFGTSAGWAWAYGARVLDENGKVTVNTPEMKQAMTDFVELAQKYGPPDQAAIGWDVMSEMFRQGKAAMNFEMSGFPSVYANKEVSSVADKIGVALIKGPADKYAQWMYGEGLAISKYSKNKEAAWLFLQWRNSLEVSLKEVNKGIRFDFPDSRVYESKEYKEKAKGLEFFTSQIDEIIGSVDTSYWPNVPEFEKIAEAFQKQISLAISGKQTVDSALTKAQQDIDKIMAGAKK